MSLLRHIVESTGPTYHDSIEKSYHFGPPAYTTEASNSVETSQSYFELTGEEIPHFHKRMKLGELLPHTAFDSQKSSFDHRGSSMVFDHTNPAAAPGGVYRFTAEGFFPDGSVSSAYTRVTLAEAAAAVPANIDNLTDVAAARIYSKGFDVATTLVELQQTRDLFKGIAGRWLKLAQALRRRKPKDVWKEASNLYLEARYGWRPLKADLENLHSAIAEFDSKRKRYSENVRRIQSRDEVVDVHPIPSVYGTWYFTTVKTIEVSIGASVTADILPPRFAINPLTTAWEVIPLSFVVDWFVAVGNYLEAVSFTMIVDRYVASSGYQVKVSKEGYVSAYFPANGYTGSVSCQSYAEGVYRSRAPALLPSSPSIRLNLDAWKVTDLTALLVQSLTKGVFASWQR